MCKAWTVVLPERTHTVELENDAGIWSDAARDSLVGAREFRRMTGVLEQLPRGPERDPQSIHRAAGLFPGLSLLLGMLASVGTAVLIGTVVLAAAIGARDVPQGTADRLTFISNLGALGVAFGVASLLSGFREKLLAGFGLVTGLVPLLLMLAMLWFGRSAASGGGS